MIIRKGNIQNSKGRINLDKLSSSDKERFDKLISDLKEAFGVDNYAFISTDGETLSFIGMGSNKSSGLSSALKTEINWLNNLTV